MPERHLGLVQAEEDAALAARLDALADLVARDVDLDALLAAARPTLRSPPAETPPGAKLLQGGGALLIAAAVDDPARSAALRAAGAEIVILPDAAGKVDLAALLDELGRRGINEVHGEAGFKLNGSLLRAGLVDELLLYLAPCLLGDAARGLFNLPELADLAGKRQLALHDLRQVGQDIRLLARLA